MVNGVPTICLKWPYKIGVSGYDTRVRNAKLTIAKKEENLSVRNGLIAKKIWTGIHQGFTQGTIANLPLPLVLAPRGVTPFIPWVRLHSACRPKSRVVSRSYPTYSG